MRFWGKGEENKDQCAGKCRRCHPMLLRILFAIVLKGSRKRDMIALDRVCHAQVNRLDKTPERITSFLTSTFDCLIFGGQRPLELERRLRIGG